METKEQIIAEIKELADKLFDEKKISCVRWVFVKYDIPDNIPKSGLVELRDELKKIERGLSDGN